MSRVIFFWSSCMLLMLFFACQTRQAKPAIAEEFCDIVCAINSEEQFHMDSLHQKLVFFEELKYYTQKPETNTWIKFKEKQISCSCSKILLIGAKEDIYNGAYQQVYKLSFSQNLDSEALKVNVVSYAYLDNQRIISKDNKIHSRNYLVSKTKNKWEVVTDDFIEPKKK